MTTGTDAFSIIIFTISIVFIPLFVPIGAASGITVTHPASSKCFAKTGSALI